ncbi:hypothetical protein H5410_039720, partial [Solanum commersonii]
VPTLFISLRTSFGLQCRKSSSPSRNTSISMGEFKVSTYGFNKISSSLSLLTKKLCYDNDDDLELHEGLMPKHIALIMDGNRRWAKAKDLEVYEGHKLIIPKLKEICHISSKLGIQVITAFAFSTENWKRSKVRV